MKLPQTGGCACGAVRYEIVAEPLLMFKCHCRDCQRLSGGGYAAGIYVPAGGLRFTKGAPHHHFTDSAKGRPHKRGFCAECGSRLTGGESDRGIAVTAGTLDDPSQFQPQVNMWAEDASPWDPLEADIPSHPQYPPM